MRSMFFRGVVLGSVTAVLVLGASAALAGTGVGGIFNLGTSNTVNAASSLSGSTAGAQLTVSNTSTSGRALSLNGSSASAAMLVHNSLGSAAAFQTPSSVAPFSVNSAVQVPSLNASLLGGHASSYFLPTTGTAAAAVSPGVLGAGKTETGVYYGVGENTSGGGFFGVAVSFTFPLNFTPVSGTNTFYVSSGGTPPAQCPGTSANPKATAGNVCIYENLNTAGNTAFVDSSSIPSKNGLGIAVITPTSGWTDLGGTWAATGAIAAAPRDHARRGEEQKTVR